MKMQAGIRFDVREQENKRFESDDGSLRSKLGLRLMLEKGRR